MLNWLTRLGGDPSEREIKRFRPLVERMNALESEYQALSPDALREKTNEFRSRLEDDETIDDLMPEAFAAAREAARRTIAKRHYDVQMLAGAVLHSGRIAEMKTGEGKTLVATLPLYLNALSGKGVHVVTVNDYLARRDSEWMGRLYNFLGLTVGIVVQGIEDVQRRLNFAVVMTIVKTILVGCDFWNVSRIFEVEDYVQRGLTT